MQQADPIVVEQTFPATLDVVWRAVTDQDQMRQWYFEAMTEFRPEVGFETQFNVSNEGRDFLHQWKVTEVESPRRIAYEWRYGGYPGEGSTLWELAETPAGTRLTLTFVGIESFPQDLPEFTRESCEAGWRFFLGDRLQEFLQQD